MKTTASLTALIIVALNVCGAKASEDSEVEASSKKRSRELVDKSDAPFQLHVESKDQRTGLRKGIFKGLTHSLISPISPRTHESKRGQAFMHETKTLKGSAAESLAKFDIELIVDESKSMLTRDCPHGASRWEWCRDQLSDLSYQLSPYLQRGFTLVTFSSDYEVLKHATTEDVIELFDRRPSASGTRLSVPLNRRFKQFFESRNANSKPVLAVVITDGMPNPGGESDLVIGSLIAASKQATSRNELTVAILQIGHENNEGNQFIKVIDDDLITRGARYDIVKSVSFVDLERIGLVKSLEHVVEGFADDQEKGAREESNLEPNPLVIKPSSK